MWHSRKSEVTFGTNMRLGNLEATGEEKALTFSVLQLPVWGTLGPLHFFHFLVEHFLLVLRAFSPSF